MGPVGRADSRRDLGAPHGHFSGRPTRQERPQVAELARDWQETNQPRQERKTAEWVGWSPKTAVTVADNFRLHILPTIGPTIGTYIADQVTGLDHWRLHDLRHTAASQMLMAGVPISVVAERLGCTEANILRTYGISFPGSDRGAVELMDGLPKGSTLVDASSFA